jgi:diguanylate cyclase (GGDEF)-like protein
MSDSLQLIANLTAELQLRHSLEEVLQLVVERAARLLGVKQASIRLLDATRSRLLVGFRTGASVHENALFEFRVGEGLVGWVARENQPLRVGRVSEDARFVPRADQQRAMESFLAVPLSHEGHCIGVLSTSHATPDFFTADQLQLFTLLSGLCSPHLEIARLARLQRVDPLTGTLNQLGLDETLPETPGEAALGPLSLALVDVDGLRHINDRIGQSAGDEVLRATGQALAGALRIGDAVVRYGGDEFLLVTPNVSLTSASRIFERARQAVEETQVQAGAERLRMTVSIGVAERMPPETRAQLVKRAATALDAAKRRGGNSVRVAIDDD